jgi:hypothetical protein
VAEVSEPERRDFVAPPSSGEFNGIDLASLDPADPDERRILILAEHPDLAAAIDAGRSEIHTDGQTMSPAMHISMHEIVANQLWDEDPPEAWETARRLIGAGYDRHEILHMLASVASAGVYATLVEARPHDLDETRAALKALPKSWERERAEIPEQRHMNRAERRAAQRRKRH